MCDLSAGILSQTTFLAMTIPGEKEANTGLIPYIELADNFFLVVCTCRLVLRRE